MTIHLYAYASSTADESDPDELFDITTDDANAWKEHLPNGTLQFQHRDGDTYVYSVFDGDDELAVLYATEDLMPKKARATTTALSASDVADAIGITAKELRVFLRADGTYKPVTAPGGRGRYQFTKADVAKIKKGYAAFVADRAKAKAPEAQAS